MRNWFTPERRLVIYRAGMAIGAIVVGALVALGILTPDKIDTATVALGALSGFIGALTNFLASLNVQR